MNRWTFAVVLAVAATTFACPWDYETYAAEWKALPCLAPVAANVLPGHSQALWKQKLEVADFELSFAPSSVESLDVRVVALLHLGRPAEAVESARRRLALTPMDYEAHANLGTALTFSGDLEGALVEIDAALSIKPDAHFGREVVHRRFVDYLVRAKKAPELLVQEDFLGRRVDLDRLAALETSKTEPSAELLESLRAVVAMLAVYGAGQVSHLWLALGDLALEARLPRTAWASWERARTLGHPRAKELEVFQRRLEGSLRTGWKPSAPIAELMKSHHLDPSEGGWAGMNRSDARERERYTAKWAEYERIERKLVKGGLSFWNAQGAQALFAEQVKLGLRCEVRDEALPQEVTEATEPVPFIRDLDPTMKCAELARALDGALSREQEAIEERARTVLRSRSGLEGIAAVGARCGPALKGVAERARAITATP